MIKKTVVLALLSLCCYSISALAQISDTEKQISNEQSTNILTQIKDQENIQNQEKIIRSIQGSKKTFEQAVVPEKIPAIPRTSNQLACTHIKNIKVAGVSIIKDSEINEITNPHLNRCLTMQDIQNIVNDITNLYLEKGFITSRAGLQLPQYGLKFGRLVISVVEGKIEKFELRNQSKSKETTYKLLFADLDKGVLNIRDIEMRLAQINRLAGQKATVEIAPGTKNSYSVVLVKIEKQNYQRFSVSFDNSGSDSTGKMKRTFKIDTNNELGFEENLSLSFNENYQENKALNMSEAWNFSLSVPYQNWLYTYSHSKSRYLTHQVLSNSDILYTYGNTQSNSINLKKTLFQKQKSKGEFSSNLTVKDEESFTRIRDLDSKSEVGSRKLANLDIGYQHTFFLENSVLFLNPSIRRGLDMFGSLSDDTSGLDTRAQFTSFKFFGYWQKPFQIGNKQFAWNTTVNTQSSQYELFGSELFSVGGEGSVRGFKKYSLSGRNGYSFQNNLSFNAFEKLKTTLFIDFGEILDSGIDDKLLIGSGIKLNFDSEYFSTSLTYSKGLTIPGHFEREEGILYFNTSFKF